MKWKAPLISNNHTTADNRSQILTWLSPIEPKLRHQDIRDRRVKNVGKWLLQTEEFRIWCASSEGGESGKAVLFCYGDPGVGKTFISSLVIDSLCDRAEGKNPTVACFYFDFAAQKEQTPTSTLGAVLRQLVYGLEEIPEEITRAYQGQKNYIGGRGPEFSDIVNMIQTVSSKKQTFICIDALDECAAEYRVKLLDSLSQILEGSPGTRIFVTGRPHIRSELGRCLARKVASVSISPKRDDIIGYLRTRLNEDTIPAAMNSGLKADILEKVPKDISEIFLLVSLNIDAILQETTIHRRRQRLATLTDGLKLGDAYGAMLNRIKCQGGEKARLGIATLMWISHSERPLEADELCHALAVEIGSANLSTDNVPSIETLLACCQGLVAVDQEDSKALLIHFTLQEYLRALPEFFGLAHYTMAETCLSYLNSHQVKALSRISFPDLQGTPFLEYSSLYWGMHAKRDLSSCAKSLALKLFNDYNNHISSYILLEMQRLHSRNVDFGKPFGFTGLHCASLFGIVGLVADLIEVEGCDINQRDCVGNTPLMWASQRGHKEVVKILQGRDGVNPNRPNKCGQTPFYRAVQNREEREVKTLSKRDDINPEKSDIDIQTLLTRATQNGNEGEVKVLLERSDVNPNKRDKYGLTPLAWAASGGSEGVVKILLGRGDVNPDKQDRNGKTPLCSAAQLGREGVVKVLLTRDEVNPDKPDNYGQTPLFCAAQNGHERVVRALLGQGGANPEKLDRYGLTPLHSAAEYGHEGVVKTLLERGDINPNKQDKSGRTPLSHAAQYGQKRVVKILLARDDVDPDKPDTFGRTPLHTAAQYRHERVVKVLLKRGNIDPNKPDNLGQTPLHYATQNGQEEVVKILLARGDINPDKPDNQGQTPLHAAARDGFEEVVKMLLERSDIDPNKPDNSDRTPLYCAAQYGQEGVVKVLLARDDVNPEKSDNLGLTPLSCAAALRHAGVVALLQPQSLLGV